MSDSCQQHVLRCFWPPQAHIASLETTQENRAALLAGLDYLLEISPVEDEEVSKICLDFWTYFVPDVCPRWAPESLPDAGTSKHMRSCRLGPLVIS